MRSLLGSYLALVSLLGPAPLAGQGVPPLPDPLPFSTDLAVERPQPIARAHGYPPLDVDRDAIRGLLEERRLGELEALLGELRDRAVADVRWESHLLSAFEAFSGPARLGGQIDAWVAATTRSAAPYVARSEHTMSRFWHLRGTGTYSDVPDAHRPEMETLLAQASRDARRGLELDSRNLAAYSAVIRTLLVRGWSPEAEVFADELVKTFPASYNLRAQMLTVMEPRWGGSYQLMDRFASDTMAYARANPRLASLRGASPIERASAARRRDRHAEAIAHIDRAAAFGIEYGLLTERGRTWYEAGDYVRALQDLHQAMALNAGSANLLEIRGRTLGSIARRLAPPERRLELLQAAAADLRDAARGAMPDDHLLEWIEWVGAARARCEADAVRCFSRPAPTVAPEIPGLWRKIVYFVLAVPITLVEILKRASQLGLGPTPIIAVLAILWSGLEWRRQRYWAPRWVHVLAGCASAGIVGLNVVWVSLGGGFWTQRLVVIVLFTAMPYVVYLLCMGPRFIGRRRRRAEDD